MTTYTFSLNLDLFEDVDDSDVFYPTEDDTPVAESDLQLIWLMYFVQALKSHFSEIRDTYAAGNMFVYFEKGNPSAVVAPDVFVVNGVENKLRDSYKVWEEGKGLDFVIEITSKSTSTIDQTQKFGTYAYLGVQEYLLFDPKREYLDPPFQFFRWIDFGFKPIEPSILADGTHLFKSETTGLEFHYLEGQVKLFDPEAGSFLQTYSEVRQAKEAERQAKEAERLAKEEAERALAAAKRKIAEIEAELARLRVDLDQ